MSDFWDLMRDAVVATGAAIVFFSLALVVLILVTAVPTQNPYVGLFVVVFLPVLTVLGGLIFVFGVLIGRPDRRHVTSKLGLLKWVLGYFRLDLSQLRQRRRLVFFVVAGALELVALSTAGFRTAQYMDTPGFCASCHTVMYPEYTVYSQSPHARVPCVSCHIGPGTPWLVRSKVTGLRQVWHTLGGDYPRPVLTPLKNLRPARETCEQCHWPQKFSGDIVRVSKHYDADEQNSEYLRSLVLKVGGGEQGQARGVHWHIGARVWYVPADEERQEMAWVGVEDDGAPTKEYVGVDIADAPTPGVLGDGKRLMDCIDCHNRATHVFYSPEELIDRGLARGDLDRYLPFLKERALDTLVPPSPSLDTALSKVESIEGFYKAAYPQVYAERSQGLERSLAYLKEVARLTTFPEMRITWETYPDNLGHTKAPGCFRCHGKLVSKEAGKPLDASCTLCHDLAAQPVSQAEPPQPTPTPSPTLQAALPGEALYEANCAACHGPRGDALPSADLGSADYHQRKGDVFLIQVTAMGIGSMPGFSDELTETQIRDIVDYLKALAEGKP
ncbi:MAG: c-type cytochrome [Chloroflexi bacterium]|nr:c-type cytochrome [Chloroflexota bacterium]